MSRTLRSEDFKSCPLTPLSVQNGGEQCLNTNCDGNKCSDSNISPQVLFATKSGRRRREIPRHFVPDRDEKWHLMRWCNPGARRSHFAKKEASNDDESTEILTEIGLISEDTKKVPRHKVKVRADLGRIKQKQRLERRPEMPQKFGNTK